MRHVTFLDLDDTLFQTAHKCPVNEPVKAVAWKRDGEPIAYMTERQNSFLKQMEQLGDLVFVTARTTDSVSRVCLPEKTWRITSFGAVIRDPFGVPLTDYNERVGLELAHFGDLYCKLRIELERYAIGLGVNVRIIEDNGLPVYVVAKHPGGKAEALDSLERLARATVPPSLFVHRNGNNLALVPRVAAKECAVRYLIDYAFPKNQWTSMGVGDSLTDGPFLACCDWAVVPVGSQLALRMMSLYSEGEKS